MTIPAAQIDDIQARLNSKIRLCGPIVKSTLAHVKGVKSVAVSQPNGMADVTATVSYNPAATSVATLIKVGTNRGYPASIKP